MSKNAFPRRSFILLTLAVAVATLGACAAPPAAAPVSVATLAPTASLAKETTLERVKREGIIRAGFANENPFGYATPAGELTGEAIEIARAIFNRMGVAQMEGILGAFGTLIPALQANRIDVISAGMYVKAARCEVVEFSEPHYCSGQGLAVAKGNPYNLHSYEDIAANSNVKIGVVTGGFEENYVKAVGVRDSQIVIFPDHPSFIAGMQSGRIDAFTMAALSTQFLIDSADDSNIERATPFTDPIIDGKSVRGCGAAGFRKEDTELRDAYNVELAKMKESGELLQILKTFGFTEQELPNVTTENLCKP